MFKNSNPKDIGFMMLTFTLCLVLLSSMIGAIFFAKENPTITEIVAFLLGSIVTIVGEYILLNLKAGKTEEKRHKCICEKCKNKSENTSE